MKVLKMFFVLMLLVGVTGCSHMYGGIGGSSGYGGYAQPFYGGGNYYGSRGLTPLEALNQNRIRQQYGYGGGYYAPHSQSLHNLPHYQPPQRAVPRYQPQQHQQHYSPRVMPPQSHHEEHLRR